MNEVVFEYTNPITLKQALAHMKKQESASLLPFQKTNLFDVFLKAIKDDNTIANIKIKKFVGNGSSAVVFETENGDILKLTDSNHFPMNRPRENFDVPIIKSGKIGKIYYYIEEKLFQHGLNDGFVKIIADMIVEKGYRPYDLDEWDVHQIGMSKDGNIYLIDPECAKYKSVFHALYKKAKKFLKNIKF